MVGSIPSWCVPASLPSTGSGVLPLVLLAVVLVAAGLVTLAIRRHRSVMLTLVVAAAALAVALSPTPPAAASDGRDCPSGYEVADGGATTSAPTDPTSTVEPTSDGPTTEPSTPTSSEPTATASTDPEPTTTVTTDPEPTSTTTPAPTSTTVTEPPTTATPTLVTTEPVTTSTTARLSWYQAQGQATRTVGWTNGTVEVPQFDATLGELQSVQLSITYSWTDVDFGYTNGGDEPLESLVVAYQNIYVDGPPGVAQFSQIDGEFRGSVTLAPGEVWNDPFAPAGQQTVAVTLTGDDLQAYVGTGNVAATISGEFRFWPGGTGDPFVDVVRTPRIPTVQVTVSYTYLPA